MKFEEYMIMNVANGFMGTYVLYTACQLKIFDYLAEQKKNANELAEEMNVTESSLVRILRPLVSYKILSADENGYFGMERAGEMLVSYGEETLWTYVMFCGKESMKVWENIYPAMIKRCLPKDLLKEKEIFETQKKDGKKFELFDGMMKCVSKTAELSTFFKKYGNQDKAYKIVDVGGGTGTIIIKFLQNFKNSRGTVIDLEAAEQGALENIKQNDLVHRCNFKVGNFFEPLDMEADIFILSRVLHDWEDEKAGTILKNVSASMKENAKLVILEGLMPDNVAEGRVEMYMNDLQMWGFCGGLERTREEFKTLLEPYGLYITEVINVSQDNTLTAMITEKTKMEEWIF